MGELRDIRADLQARLSGVEEDIVAEEERHRHLLEQLRRRRDLLKQMLEDEEGRWARTQPSLFAFSLAAEQPEGRTPLTELVCDIMSDGQQWSLDRLVEAVEEHGWNFSGKNPRRVMHFTLLGLKNKGSAEMPVSGSWRLHTQVRESDAAPS